MLAPPPPESDMLEVDTSLLIHCSSLFSFTSTLRQNLEDHHTLVRTLRAQVAAHADPVIRHAGVLPVLLPG